MFLHRKKLSGGGIAFHFVEDKAAAATYQCKNLLLLIKAKVHDFFPYEFVLVLARTPTEVLSDP